MKYRVLFLVKLGYYLPNKQIILDINLYSLFIEFICSFSFTEKGIEILCKMGLIQSVNYKMFLNSYQFIKDYLCESTNYDEVNPEFYKLFTEEELEIVDDFVWSFYNFYAEYLFKISDGEELLPYDYRNSTKIYVLS